MTFLARYRVQVQPEGAQLLVDHDEPVFEDGLLLLDLGRHTLEVRAEGFETRRITLDVTFGDVETVEVALRPMPAAAPPSETAEARQPWYRKWWVWTIVGVGVAGGATTAAILATRGDSEELVVGDSGQVIFTLLVRP